MIHSKKNNEFEGLTWVNIIRRDKVFEVKSFLSSYHQLGSKLTPECKTILFQKGKPDDC